MADFYNTCLRPVKDHAAVAIGCYPFAGASARTRTRFTATIHAISSGVVKIAALTPVALSYCPQPGVSLPTRFVEPDSLGACLGIESAFISTTLDKAVALRQGTQLYQFAPDSLNKGAAIRFLSQYPLECEIVFPPLTALEATGWPAIECAMGRVSHMISLRPILNHCALR